MASDEVKATIARNKDVLGLFKDEAEGAVITEMAFLRAKMYTYSKTPVSPSQKEPNVAGFITKPIMKAKGVKKSAMKQVTVEQYRRCLFPESIDDKLKRVSFYRIASQNHVLRTVPQTKKSISHFDDKRFYLNGIQSRAHGHWRN